MAFIRIYVESSINKQVLYHNLDFPPPLLDVVFFFFTLAQCFYGFVSYAIDFYVGDQIYIFVYKIMKFVKFYFPAPSLII